MVKQSVLLRLTQLCMSLNRLTCDHDEKLETLLAVIPDDNIVLCLRFFQLAIVVGFKLHQRSKYILILVGILISQQYLQVHYSINTEQTK